MLTLTPLFLNAFVMHQPLRPCLLWMDVRASQQARRVASTGDGALVVNGGGAGPVSAEWMIPKALWLKENEPDIYHRATWVCEYQVQTVRRNVHMMWWMGGWFTQLRMMLVFL